MLVVKEFNCTHFSIQQDVPLQMWEGISSFDGTGLPIWLVRLLHNKVRYYGSNYAECYAYYWSPKFFLNVMGAFGGILFLVLLFFAWKYMPKKYHKFALAGIVIYPLIFIFEIL